MPSKVKLMIDVKKDAYPKTKEKDPLIEPVF